MNQSYQQVNPPSTRDDHARPGGRRRLQRFYQRRYLRIVGYFVRVITSLLIWDLLLPRIGMRRWSRKTRPERLRQSAARFRLLAISMGGVMIKVGQFFSSRGDVLPEEITAELSGLQDEVPPEDFNDIRRVAEAEFGMRLEEKFAHFDPQPWAAASLGQVHLARLGPEPSRAVVVKIQRPDIEQIIAVDLRALRTVGNWLRYYRPLSRRVNIPALMNEFTRILLEEIDYLAEGRNAETFAANFTGQSGVCVPEVVWTHTTQRVLTLQDVRGIKITDYQAISKAGVDRTEVAKRLMNTYLKQIFEDGFFHADPHPGNLFVEPLYDPQEREEKGTDWQLTFVDFGMVGRVPPTLLAGMREMIIGVGMQDPARVVKAYQMMGVLLPGADLKMIEAAEEEVFKRFWGKGMDELKKVNLQEMHEFAHRFRELIYDLPVQMPQDLILLARTVGILAGMCSGMDPKFNVFEGLVPFAQKLVAEESGLRPEKWLEAIGIAARKAIQFPGRLDRLLGMVEQGELSVRVPELMDMLRRLERTIYQAIAAIIFAACLLAGVLFYLSGFIQTGALLHVAAGFILAWIILNHLRGR